MDNLNDSIRSYFTTHKTLLLAANLVLMDGKVYKDRSGKYLRVEEPVRVMIPANDISKVSVEGLDSGTIITYDSPDGLTIIISTVPIKFNKIK